MIEQVRPWYDDSLSAQARARVQEQLTNDFEMFVEHATQEERCFLSHVLGDANSVADLFEGLALNLQKADDQLEKSPG